MEKTQILMTRSLLPVDQEYITEGLRKLVGDSFELVTPPSFDEEGILSVVETADVLLGPYVTKNILEKGKNIKLIQVPWTGMDTFNFSEVNGSDVPLCNSHSNSDAVAELGVTLVLDLLKKVSYHDRKMRRGNWNRDKKPLDLTSQMISNQVICILGYGSIGSKMGKLLSAFGAKILAVTEHKHNFVEAQDYLSENMMDPVSQASVVVNTLPLTEKTRGLIDEEFISKMKTGAYLVNVSRAAVVDERAVFEGLRTGKLAGYASDVWWNAPKRGESQSWPSTKNKFEELEQVIMSPHRAGFVNGSLPHLDDAIINLAHLINGESLINVVDVSRMF